MLVLSNSIDQSIFEDCWDLPVLVALGTTINVAWSWGVIAPIIIVWLVLVWNSWCDVMWLWGCCCQILCSFCCCYGVFWSPSLILGLLLDVAVSEEFPNWRAFCVSNPPSPTNCCIANWNTDCRSWRPHESTGRHFHVSYSGKSGGPDLKSLHNLVQTPCLHCNAPSRLKYLTWNNGLSPIIFVHYHSSITWDGIAVEIIGLRKERTR
jgi:hypothetical protein